LEIGENSLPSRDGAGDRLLTCEREHGRRGFTEK